MALSTAIEIHSLRTLSGPNIWSHRPVLEGLLDTSELTPVDLDLADELFAVPGRTVDIVEVATADRSEAVAAWFAAAVVRVQAAGNCPVEFHTSRPTTNTRDFQVAFEYEEESLGLAAADLVLRWLHSLAKHEPFDVTGEWEAWRDLAEEVRLDLSTGPKVALDRALTRQMLSEIGIPVPLERTARDVEDACVAAHRIGWPVIVRSLANPECDVVPTRLTSADEVRAAYSAARRSSERVAIERFVEGKRYRLLVADGRFVDALRPEAMLAAAGAESYRTGHVHPRIATLAVDAARVVGLGIAGIDVVASDLTRSPFEQEFVVLDVVPEPAEVPNPACPAPTTPSNGAKVAHSISAELKSARLPLIAVLGRPRDPYVAERVAAELSIGGQTIGLASREGAWIGGLPIGPSRDSVGEHLRRLWRHPRTELVVVQVTLSDILREGLPFDRCDELIETGPLEDVWATSNQPDPADVRRALECIRRSFVARPATLHDDRWVAFRAK